LCIELMRGAADDIDRGGVVAWAFDGIPTPPGSVPQLRILACRVGGATCAHPRAADSAAHGVWPVAAAAIPELVDQVRGRLHRTVQTNEPGRSAVLFAGLLWLANRHRCPIRLFEVGASAGLNLLADRYSYAVDGHELGDPDSPLRFVDPWMPPPPIDLTATASALRIVARAGCDLAPLDPAQPDDQITLLSYIWPDEPHRIERMRAALSVAAREAIPTAAPRGAEWLFDVLGDRGDGELAVAWHSVMRQYVEPDEWTAIELALDGRPRVVRLSMEPATDGRAPMVLSVHDPAGAPGTRLAVCDDHGLPIRWET
jgi:hypothetical protein